MNGRNSDVKYVSAEEGGSHVVFSGPPGNASNKSCLSKWSKFELRITFLCAFLALVIVALIVIIATRTSSKAPYEVCLKKDCVTAASRILTYMDANVDPCDHFYDFACGNWNKTNIIPADKSSYSTFSKLTEDLDAILKQLLEKPSDGDPEALVKAKDLYKSCMNESQIDHEGLEPINRLLAHLGGWPILDADRYRSVSSDDVLDVLVKLSLLNNVWVINHYVEPDDKNSNAYILQFDQTKLGMAHKEFFLDPLYRHKLDVYRKYAYDVAVMFGAEPEVAKKDVADMIAFEQALANITVPETLRRDSWVLYNKMTVKDLIEMVPGFQWLEYLQRLYSIHNITITEDEPLVNFSPSYYKDFGPLYAATEKRTIVNYLIWRIMMSRVQNLPKDYRKIKNEYHKAISGSSHDPARWVECATIVNRYMGNALSLPFVEEYFDATSMETASEMIHSIRESIYQLLDEAEWMDNATRKVAKEKAKYMLEVIGYPTYIHNETALNAEYSDVQYHPDHYFDNVITHLRHQATAGHKVLRQPVDRTTWETQPCIVNAYYSANKNSIIIPAGILQPPFYSKDYPKSMNYGGIGMVIGHEITHGFDDKGRQFDKDGNLRIWWDQDTINAFKERAKCIIDQYGSYTSRTVDLNVNGIHTQGENIADNGGLKEAYMAYKKYVRTHNEPPQRLPGLSQFNDDQLFFINFAQVWCGSIRPEHAEERLKTGTHSPGIFRVIGTLQNMESFSQTFNCPVGSYMNRKDKCKVW